MLTQYKSSKISLLNKCSLYIVDRGGNFESKKPQCVFGAENDQSNPKLQLAWQRLKSLLPPLITTGNQLPVWTRDCLHKTSLGSSGDTVLLGKQPQGFTERPGTPRFSIRITSPCLWKEGGWQIYTRSSRWFSGFLLDVYPYTSFQDSDALFSVMTYSSPQTLPFKWKQPPPVISIEKLTLCTQRILKSLQSQTNETRKHETLYQTLHASLSCLQPDLRQVELFGQGSISKH